MTSDHKPDLSPLNDELEAMLRRIVHEEVTAAYRGTIRQDMLQMLAWFFNEENYDIAKETQRVALHTSAQKLGEKIFGLPAFKQRFELMRYALAKVQNHGLCMEFGVAAGESLQVICESMPQRTVFGFDSFAGLPENWRTGFPAGTFAQQALPSVPDNAVLISGLFADTLPTFFLQHPDTPCAFLHIDCDLYSSTKEILQCCKGRIQPGTVILFDEYCNYPGWQEHEYKAFMEFCEETGCCFEYLGYVKSKVQVAVIITSIESSI